MRQIEQDWINEFDRLEKIHSIESLALLHQVYSQNAMNIIYSKDTTDEFKDAYHARQDTYHKLPSNPATLGCLFDIYSLFRALGYDTGCTQRENYYEGLIHQEDQDKSLFNTFGNVTIDIFCNKEKSGLSLHINSNGRWGFSDYGSSSHIGKLKLFKTVDDLLSQLSLGFNFIMGTDYDFKTKLTELDNDEVLHEEELQGKELTEAALIRHEEERALRIQTKAFARIGAFLEGKDDPYPDED